MSEVAVGYVSLVPKFGSGFKAAIAGEIGQAGVAGGRTAGASFKSTFLGVLAGNLMTSVLGKIGGAIKGAFGGGFDRLMNIEQAEIKLKTLGLNVKAVMGNVGDAVDGTKFAISDAADMAAFLGASGVKAGGEMTAWLKRTADAAQFTNRDFADVQRTIGKVVAEGRVTGETFQELPLAAAALADHLGISQEEVRKLASQGKISAAEFGEAMDAKIGGAARNAGDSFLSVVANLKTAMNASAANLMKPFVDGLKPVLTAGLGLVKGFRDGVSKPLGESLGEWIQPKAEALAASMATWPAKIGAFVASARAGLQEVADGFAWLRDLAAPVVDGIRAAFQGLTGGRGLGSVFETLKAVAVPALEAVRDAAAGFIDGFGGLDGIVSAISGVLPLVTGPIGILHTALLDVFSSGGGAGIDFRGFGETVGAALQPVVKAASELAGVLVGEVASAIATLLPVALDLGGTLVDVAGGLASDLLPILSQLAQDLLPVVAGLVSDLAPVLSDVAAALFPLVGQLVEGLVPALMGLIESALPPLVGILTTVGTAIGDLVTALAPLIGVLLEALVPAVVAVAETLGPLVGYLLGVVDVVLGIVIPALTGLTEIFSTLLLPILETFAEVTGTVFATVQSVIESALIFLEGLVKAATAALRGDWEGAHQAIQAATSAAWENLKAAFRDGVERVVTSVRELPGKAAAALESLAPGLLAKARDAWDQTKTAFQAGIDTAVALVRSLPDKAKAALGNVSSALTQAGRDLVRGFVDGITAGLSWVATAARNLAQSAIRAAKNALDSHSPSMVFDRIGQDTGQGLINGLSKMGPKVAAAAENMATILAKAAATGVSKALSKKDLAGKSGRKLLASFGVSMSDKDAAAAKAAQKRIAEGWAKTQVQSAQKQLAAAKKAGKGIAAAEAHLAVVRKASASKLKADRELVASTITNDRAAAATVKAIQAGREKISSTLKRDWGKLTTDVKTANSTLYKVIDQLNKVKTPVTNGLAKLLEQQRKQLVDVIKARDKVREQLAEANKALETVLKEHADFVAGLSAKFADMGQVMAADTADGMIAAAQAQLEQIKAFKKNVSKLMKMGISDALLREITEAGLEKGSATAAALVAGGQEAVDTLNGLHKQIAEASESLAEKVGKQLYQAGIDAAKGLVKGLKSQESELAKAAKQLGDTIAAGIKTALQIKSPSRVLDQLGKYAGRGLVNGLTAMVSDTAAAAKRLAVAAVPDIAPATLTMPALTAPVGPAEQSLQDQLLAELMLLRQALANLTVVDAGGQLITRMRVEARREISDVVTMAGMRR